MSGVQSDVAGADAVADAAVVVDAAAAAVHLFGTCSVSADYMPYFHLQSDDCNG